MTQKSSRNKTIALTELEIRLLEKRLLTVHSRLNETDVIDKTILGDTLEVIDYLPNICFADMLFVDPPYNMKQSFSERHLSREWQAEIMKSWVSLVVQ